MTEQEQIEYLATKVMGWESIKHPYGYTRHFRTGLLANGDGIFVDAFDWNPLTDWNHLRQVEEKIMEDEKFTYLYLNKITSDTIPRSPVMRLNYFYADKQFRVSCAISAHQQLS